MRAERIASIRSARGLTEPSSAEANPTARLSGGGQTREHGCMRWTDNRFVWRVAAEGCMRLFRATRDSAFQLEGHAHSGVVGESPVAARPIDPSPPPLTR
jgi:hypothetical protein